MMLSTQNGGAETFFEKLVIALADAGVYQDVVIEPHERREHLFAKHPNIRIHTLRFRGFHELLGRARLHLLLRRQQPDLLMTWMSRAIKRAPTGYCPIVARLGGYYRVERYRKSDRLIGNTPDIVRYLQKEGIAADKTQCIPNFGEIAPCDTDESQARNEVRQQYGIPDSHKVLLALGRLHPAKAHDTLIQAVALTDNTSLLIAGDGPLKSELEQLIVELKLQGRVHLLGWRRDTSYLFKASDICVFPSREEPFGNVVVEAWAQQVPLVTTAAAGPSWLVTPGEDGLLVQVDDVSALAEAINQVCENEALRKRLVRNGLNTFTRLYSREAIATQYIEMFNDVIAGKPVSEAEAS
ncbi:glycosyltransferase [Marinobacterium sp. AK62]|uniref:Glycosyltransferase n=1 Tax=Marinobacterium alkalitolerans TaxID=1542925 RepID=A0ABS3Z678_9GAMM|nr:glycosyltransferase [Marinobacterium alkalitolerans]